jgi:hypothetical protein
MRHEYASRFYSLVDMSTRQKNSRIRLREMERLQAGLDMLSILRKPYLGTYLRHIELDQAPASSYNGSFDWPTAPPAPTNPQPRGSEFLKQAIAQVGFEEPEKNTAVLDTLLLDPGTI